MSEIINNNRIRVDQLKSLLKELHAGISIEETRIKLLAFLKKVPYGEVVQAEQELIQEGLPAEEIMKFCDVHSEAMKSTLDISHAKTVDENHPIYTFTQENKEIQNLINSVKEYFNEIENIKNKISISQILLEIQIKFNSLIDINKHYERKENLLFPILEKHKIEGVPKVMWGKDNEIRTFLKSSMELFKSKNEISYEELQGFIELMFLPTLKSVEEMIFKEENILFPMSLDTLTDLEWYEIYEQSNEIGYCLYYPVKEWKPLFIENSPELKENFSNKIDLPTGSFLKEELSAVFSTLPFDITFVDKEDKVRYFSESKERIFHRSKLIIGRLVQYCHPPSSVHIVEKILQDFKSGNQDEAAFWINMHGKFILISYFAVRNEKGEYLGTVEVTQDVTKIRSLEGERRLLTYDKIGGGENE